LTSSVRASAATATSASATLHVGLDDQRQRLRLALAHVLEHVLELGGLLLGQLDVAVLAWRKVAISRAGARRPAP
jgi:hypothetical protein